MAYDLKGQVAVVTGAGGELGRVISRALLECQVNVVMLDSDREAVARACSQLAFGAGQPWPFPADVTNEDQVRAAFQYVKETSGRLDLLVNNAAITGPTALLTEISRADWDRVLAVNLAGAFLCAREALRLMAPAGRGKIINISSVAGKIGYPLRAPYSASKWGLIGLTATLAQEYGKNNIQVNAICPGPIAGPQMDRILQKRAEAAGVSLEQARQEFMQATALRRFVQPQDVAALVTFLASPAGDNITGQALEVSAGWGSTFD